MITAKADMISALCLGSNQEHSGYVTLPMDAVEVGDTLCLLKSDDKSFFRA